MSRLRAGLEDVWWAPSARAFGPRGRACQLAEGLSDGLLHCSLISCAPVFSTFWCLKGQLELIDRTNRSPLLLLVITFRCCLVSEVMKNIKGSEP